MKIGEANLPAGHPHIAQSLNNLAGLYVEQGRLTHAQELLKRALSLREVSLPAGHPQIAESINNLALLRAEQGRLTEADHSFFASPFGQHVLPSLFCGQLPLGYRMTPGGHSHHDWSNTDPDLLILVFVHLEHFLAWERQGQ